MDIEYRIELEHAVIDTSWLAMTSSCIPKAVIENTVI